MRTQKAAPHSSAVRRWRMSKQQDIVPKVIQLVAECGVPVGLILGGSVAGQHGRYL